MVKTRSKVKRKCSPKGCCHSHREGDGYGRYTFLLFIILLIVGMAHATEPSSEPTKRDLDCMIYVTPDFQVLPASSFSLQEGIAVYTWMCDGHLAGVIPRGDGYQVTIRHDTGILETRYFSEFSNGQPFCPPAPGCRRWAYALNEEEVAQARQYYGQEMSWLDLIKAVAPEEYGNMDYTTRAETAYRNVRWPDNPDGFVIPWTLAYHHCSIASHYSPAEVGSLFPDLSSESVGRRSLEGPGWKVEIVIQEPKDLNQNSYRSMLDFYRVQYPDVYTSLSPTEQQNLEAQPPRVGYVNILTTPDREQQEILRTIWGTEITNEEYYTLLWPELWGTLPAWFKEYAWTDNLYRWQEPDPEHGTVPSDYILPEDRLPPFSYLPTSQTIQPVRGIKEEPHDMKFNVISPITPHAQISFDPQPNRSTLPAISRIKNQTNASGLSVEGIREVNAVKESLSQVSGQFPMNTPPKMTPFITSSSRINISFDEIKQRTIPERIAYLGATEW